MYQGGARPWFDVAHHPERVEGPGELKLKALIKRESVTLYLWVAPQRKF